MVRSLVTVLICILLASLAVLLWPRSSGTLAPSAGGVPSAPSPAGAQVEPQKVLAQELAKPPEESGSPRTPLEPETAPGAAVVQGRVLDEEGTMIPGAKLTFHSVGALWAEGQGRASYETTSDDRGHFLLEVPVPTSDWISLLVDGGVYHGRTGRHFGPAGGRNQPRLVPGVNAVGDIILASTGAIAGHVRDAGGAPIRHAWVTLQGAHPGGYTVNAQALADGSYTMSGVPPGTHALTANADGFASAEAAKIEVARLRTTHEVDFVLARAPILAGWVVDDEGKPVSGVVVRGYPLRARGHPLPARGAPYAFATTRKDGSFELDLRAALPHALEVRSFGPFETWGGGVASPDSAFAPGTEDVRIELKRFVGTRLEVVDADTGEYVPRFWVREIPLNTYRTLGGKQDMREFQQPGEPARVPAEPGSHRIVMLADGYGPFEGPILHDRDASGQQTVALVRSSSLRGQVLLNGVGVPHAGVSLSTDLVRIDPRLPEGEDAFDENMRSSLPGYPGRERSATSTATGAFHFSDLAAGVYVLVVRAPGCARKVLRGVSVGPTTTEVLEPIHLEPEASVQGHLLLPGGASPLGVVLEIRERTRPGDWWPQHRDARLEIRTLDGAFRFTGLAAGEYEIAIPAVAGLQPQVYKLALSTGEASSLDLDLR